MTRSAILAFAIFASSGCGDDPNCWPVSVGTTYAVTVKESLPLPPAIGRPSCGPSFDVELGTVLRMLPTSTIKLEGRSCQDTERTSLVEDRNFGGVTLTQELLPCGCGEGAFFNMSWTATLPSGCTGEWTVFVEGSAPSRIFETYQLGNPGAKMTRSFFARESCTDADVPLRTGCQDLWGVEVKPLP